MKVKTVTLRLIKNLGNYESAQYELTAELTKGEEPDFQALRAIIEEQHARMYAKPSNAPKTQEKAVIETLDVDERADSKFQRVTQAIREGRVTVEDMHKYYNCTAACYAWWAKHLED